MSTFIYGVNQAQRQIPVLEPDLVRFAGQLEGTAAASARRPSAERATEEDLAKARAHFKAVSAWTRPRMHEDKELRRMSEDLRSDIAPPSRARSRLTSGQGCTALRRPSLAKMSGSSSSAVSASAARDAGVDGEERPACGSFTA